MIGRRPADIRSLNAMNARVYDMTPDEAERWYAEHPLSSYEDAAAATGWRPEDGHGCDRQG